jgi:hypothetical protein
MRRPDEESMMKSLKTRRYIEAGLAGTAASYHCLG